MDWDPRGPGDAGSGTRGPVLARAPLIRAFPNKKGGWTVLSGSGEFLEFQGAAALALWDELETGAPQEDLIEKLAIRFPAVAASVLLRDALAFLAALERAGLVRRRDGPLPG